MQTDCPSPAEFWRAVESGGPLSGPGWLSNLHDAARADARFDLAAVREALGRVGPLEETWRHVHELLLVRALLREGRGQTLDPLLTRCEQLLSLPLDVATRCRVLHTTGVLQLRLERHAAAEVTLHGALPLADDGPIRLWILDSIGQCYQGQASWTEARRVLREVIRHKKALGDLVGTAISGGNLALLELGLGNDADADAVAGSVLAHVGTHVPDMTRLRVETLRVQARLGTPAVTEATQTLEALLDRTGPSPHHLKAFAALALARASASDPGKWLDLAAQNFSSPADQAHLQYWRLQLQERPGAPAALAQRLEALCEAAPPDSEAELLAHLALADCRGSAEEIQVHLEAAYRCALRGNNPLWMERVDRACERLDPTGFRGRLLERYTGQGLGEIQRTAKEEATFIFADLVGFTSRSVELSPEEVMETVRSLFELTVPLLVRYRARPLQYLGDCVLAVCQGEGHAARGLGFSRTLVARSMRATSVRRALGDRWGLTVRAGVASGTAVFGVLGSHHKMDFQAIGRTVNLAARLQGQAEPAEVVASRDCVKGAGLDTSGLQTEIASLKGFPEPEPFYRFPVSASELAT